MTTYRGIIVLEKDFLYLTPFFEKQGIKCIAIDENFSTLPPINKIALLGKRILITSAPSRYLQDAYNTGFGIVVIPSESPLSLVSTIIKALDQYFLWERQAFILYLEPDDHHVLRSICMHGTEVIPQQLTLILDQGLHLLKSTLQSHYFKTIELFAADKSNQEKLFTLLQSHTVITLDENFYLPFSSRCTFNIISLRNINIPRRKPLTDKFASTSNLIVDAIRKSKVMHQLSNYHLVIDGKIQKDNNEQFFTLTKL